MLHCGKKGQLFWLAIFLCSVFFVGLKKPTKLVGEPLFLVGKFLHFSKNCKTLLSKKKTANDAPTAPTTGTPYLPPSLPPTPENFFVNSFLETFYIRVKYVIFRYLLCDVTYWKKSVFKFEIWKFRKFCPCLRRWSAFFSCCLIKLLLNFQIKSMTSGHGSSGATSSNLPTTARISND